ncbi:hypothetical protein Taro_031847 [Colocasia esculenta]|uniref:CCHC-type domain-containing protein n=1 Tax=Colocasia esculenta TaxID=4460 RepID=A0A843W7M5_COLES|nr:hypothetical protein [Colocasia esculenta]
MAAQGYAEGTTAITAADKSKLSLNFKAKNYLCCALSKREFNRVSACKSAKEIWDKLQITYEGTDKVKQTRIDILVSQYEQFKMLPNENITQMYNRFSSIEVGLSSLGKNLSDEETVRKILRSLTVSWTPKVTAIEDAHDLTKFSIDKLIGSLMAYEINMKRLSESSSKKKCTNALKVAAAPSTSSSSSSKIAGSEDSDVDEVLSKLQKILKKKKNESRMIQRKEKKEKEPVCYECRIPEHLRPDCPRLKKTGQTESPRSSTKSSKEKSWQLLGKMKRSQAQTHQAQVQRKSNICVRKFT